jgi:hypothetical protein
MTQNAKITFSAVGTVLGHFGLAALLEWSGLRWEVWYRFAVYTLFVFGIVIYGYRSSLRRRKCLVLLGGMMVLHVLGLGYYLASSEIFPKELYFLAPFECAAMAAVLVGIGGARVFRPGVRERKRRKEAGGRSRRSEVTRSGPYFDEATVKSNRELTVALSRWSPDETGGVSRADASPLVTLLGGGRRSFRSSDPSRSFCPPSRRGRP